MRSPQRIPELLDLLNQLWHQDPDLRFNQLIYNLQGEFSSQNGGRGRVVETASDGFETIGFDLFNLEDDEFMDFLHHKLAGEQV